jgi:hypothetical protein
MDRELEAALYECFAGNRGTGRPRDYVGVRVHGAAVDRSEFDLTLTFKSPTTMSPFASIRISSRTVNSPTYFLAGVAC